MRWTDEEVLRFLELYKRYPCIWNPKHVHHKRQLVVSDAWKNIKKKMRNKFPVEELKRKKVSLMASYRWHRIRIIKSERSGTFREEPLWFAFSSMDSFLRDSYTPGANTGCSQSELDCNDENTNDCDPLNEEHDSSRSGSPLIPRVTTPKKRNCNSPEIQQSKRKKDQTFDTMQSVPKPQVHEDDEYGIYGKLIAKKMRRLSEDSRDLMMIQIIKLFYNENSRHD